MTKPLRSHFFFMLLLLLLVMTAGFIEAAAQVQHSDIPSQRNCSAMEVLNRQLAQDPSRANALQSIEAQTARFIENQQTARNSSGVITIPVVVHVVYNNSTENISDAQIHSQIKVLNEDFRRANADANNTWSQAADTEIEFKLATVNAMGTSTRGITRTATSVTSFSTNDDVKYSNRGGRNAWPAGSYLNIWVCNLSGNTLGYAQFPGGQAQTDGVVVDYQYFGTTGTATAPFNLGRTTTHEVGHWLNLRHIWGDGDCSVDDEVSDTPSADAPNYSCATGSTSCSSVNMVENYMDYSDDACMNLFTAGQKSRMQALFASGGARSEILNSPGLGGSTPTEPACNTNTLSLKLLLDDFPAETSWQLKNSSGSVVASGGSYSTPGALIKKDFCLPDGCYDFIIKDTYGDGICCTYGNGSYSLTDASGKVLASGGNFGASQTKNICLNGGSTTTPPACPSINFSNYTFSGFASEDHGTHQVQDGGTTLYLSGNTWKQIPYNYTVTTNTVLEFEFRSTQVGEIQGIAFENDNSISPNYTFRVYGNQNWGISNYKDYSGTSWKKYVIPVGNFFTGSFNKLVFIGDDDSFSRQTSYFRHVKVYEGSCGGTRAASNETNGPARVGNEGESAGFGLRLYPNPGKEVVNLGLSGGKTATATLYDVRGQKVWQGALKENETISIAISHLPAGIYTLQATAESGERMHQKFIKQ